MMREICTAATMALMVLVSGCTTLTADWNNRPPLPPSGDYASG
jgi:hypothetical protein